MNICQPYLDFIKYSITQEQAPPESYHQIDWREFLQYCNRQGIIGLIFDGLQRADIRIEQDVLFEWISFAESIKVQNAVVNKRIEQITKFFEEKGFRSCVLKGQANGLMYPKSELRSPGDIDIWVDGGREDIIKMVKSVSPDAHYSIHHIKLPVYKDLSVEVHYRPIYMMNWFTDKKLQRNISNVEERQFSHKIKLGEGKIGCLTDDFNVVYQLLHMFAHFGSTRNNFKQFLDYFFLLRKGLNPQECKDSVEMIKELGLYKYVTGIMWIMSEVLGLEEKFLIVKPNEKEGKLILKESFYFGTWSTSKLRSVIEQFMANFRIVTHYPMDVLISPLFLVWHQWWKLKMKISL